MLPNGRSEADIKALKTLRAYPEETRRLLIAALSKGGKRGRPDADSLMGLLIPETARLDVVRSIVASYDRGELATPFLGYLAYFGEEGDMKWLIGIVNANPDNSRAVELAKVMVEGNNPNAHAALHSLNVRTSGKWRESSELKRFLAETVADMGGSGPAVSSAKAGGALVQAETPAIDSARPSVPTPSGSPPEPSANWQPWGIGGGLLLALLVFLFRKSK